MLRTLHSTPPKSNRFQGFSSQVLSQVPIKNQPLCRNGWEMNKRRRGELKGEGGGPRPRVETVEVESYSRTSDKVANQISKGVRSQDYTPFPTLMGGWMGAITETGSMGESQMKAMSSNSHG